MKPGQRMTVIIEREDDGFARLCSELDFAILIEALTLFLETADSSEVARGSHDGVVAG
jgi:hypothetical protein